MLGWFEDAAAKSHFVDADSLIQYMNLAKTIKVAYCQTADSFDGFIMGEIREQGGEKILSIQLAAGNTAGKYDEISALLEMAAKDLGCSSMEMLTRRGMMKVMKPEGWEESYVVIVKKV